MHFSDNYGFGIVDDYTAVRLAESWNKQSTHFNENFFTLENSDRIAIEDNSTTGKLFTISESNMHNIENVEVEINLSHLSPADLTIKLISPNGTQSTLMDRPTKSAYEGEFVFNFSSSAFLGESVDGDWRLLITDSKTGDVGYLNSWKLKFYGELDDGKNDFYVYTEEFAKMTDGSRGIIFDNDSGVDTINANAVSTDSIINLNAGEISRIAGHDVLIFGGGPSEEYYQKQTFLINKEATLSLKNSELSNKNQSLSTKNIEFVGINAEFDAKALEYNKKQTEYEKALTNFSDIKWWVDYSYIVTIYNIDIYQNKTNKSIKKLSKNQVANNNNNYAKALSEVNQKTLEFNIIEKEFNELNSKINNLPTEIANLTNEVNEISNQINSLKSEINLIKIYLDSFNKDGASAIENAYTGDGNDKIIGSDLANEIWGGRGENILTGNGGFDTFIIKNNSTNIDIITDFKVGEDKIDLTDFKNISLADILISQNDVNVEIALSSGQKIILENINVEQILTDSFIGIANNKNSINGTFVDDDIVGTDDNDFIIDNFGNDIIKSLQGDDEINAGAGNDKIFGGNGDDIIFGGSGNDLIYADGDLDSSGEVIGNDMRGNKNKIFGGDGDDTIFGGSGNDYINGGNGGDNLYGGDGNDVIIVGAGSNQVDGGGGDDVIYLNGNNFAVNNRINFVSGGVGSDKFILDNSSSFSNEINIITDFDVNDSNEIIDLSKIKAVSKYSDLKISQQGFDTQIIVNSNLVGSSQVIRLENVDVSKLNSSKFVISNEAPKVSDDSVLIQEDKSILINILSNDFDDKTDLTKIKITIFQPTNGSVVVNSNGTVTYKPKDNFNGIDEFEYELIDGGGLTSTKAKVIVNVSEVHDAPFVIKIINDKIFYPNREINFRVNDIFAEDDDGDFIYSASLLDGSNLPSWLNFNPLTQTFSGISPLKKEEFIIKLVATDEGESSTSINFNFKIDDGIILGSDGNDIIDGTTGNDIIDGGKGDDIIIGNNGNDILFGGEGNDKIFSSGKVSNDVLNGGLGSDIFVIGNAIISNDIINDFDIFDPNEKIDFSNFAITKHGFSTLTKISDLKITQVESDAKITFDKSLKTLTIKNVKASDLTEDKFILNNAPTINGKIPNQKILINKDFSLNFDSLFNDIDGDILSYSANFLDDSPLPSWINFDANTLNFSGRGDVAGDYNIKLNAIDKYGAKTSANFKLIIDDGTIIGTNSNDILDAENVGFVINGGEGDDKITGNNSGNNLIGGDDNDTIFAGLGSDIINGGNGNDRIFTGAGNDVVYAGSGNDEINITGSGDKTISGGDNSDLYKIYSFDGDITINDFNINDPNEKINLEIVPNIFSFSDLDTSQSGSDAIIQISLTQKIILKNVNKDLISADKFIFYNNNFNGSPIKDEIYDGETNDLINSYGGDDFIHLEKSGLDIVNLGDGDDRFNLNEDGYLGNDNVWGGAGNDKFTIDLGSSDGDLNYNLTINDFEATNPNEKIYIFNSWIPNLDFIKDLKIDQIGNDVQIGLSELIIGKKLILKNVNKADLNANNIILPKVAYNYATQTTKLDDNITYNPNAGNVNNVGKDVKIPVGGTIDIVSSYFDPTQSLISFLVQTENNLISETLVNATVLVEKNLTTYTYKSFDPAKDRLGIDSFYNITKYSDLSIIQVPRKNDVAINFPNQKVKIILKNVSLNDLRESNFIFYNNSTNGNDLIDGNNGNDHLEGGKGDDKINGGDGNDEIYGGDGNDILIDNLGVNKIFGGAGNDVLGFASSQSNSNSNNELFGDEGDDVFYFNADEVNIAKGGVGNDYFNIYGGDNQIFGEDGIDNFVISKFSANEINYALIDKVASTTIYDFNPYAEKITLNDFDEQNLDQFSIVQDGNDVVLNFSFEQNLRLINVQKSALNQDNIIIANKNIQDNYYYTFDNKMNEYSINDLNKLMVEGQQSYDFVKDKIIDISSHYDHNMMQMVSNFDETKDKIHLGKIKTIEKFEDLKITQHVINEQNSRSEFTLIDLGNATFVKLTGLHNLTVDNFLFNKSPIANLISASIDENVSQKFDVLSETLDAEGDSLQIASVTSASNGIASIIIENGKQLISYIPNSNYCGNDNFDYVIEDGRGGVTTKTLNVTVTSTKNPLAGGLNSINLNEDESIEIDLFADMVDANNNVMASVINKAPTKGTLIENQSGTWQYTPNHDFNGNDYFEYQVFDGNGVSIVKNVNITVNPVNDNPTSNLVSTSVDEDNKLVVNVLEQAFDIDADQLLLSIKNSPTNGVANIVDIASNDADDNVIYIKKIEYNPNINFNGFDSLVYEVSDGNGGFVDKTLNIEVKAVNDAISASNIETNTDEDNAVLIDVLSQVDNVDVEQLSIVGAYGVTSGVANVINGKILYMPDANYNGVISFKYVIADDYGEMSTKYINVVVNPINDAPIANVSDVSSDEDKELVIDVLSSASDVENDNLTLSLVTNPLNGSAKIIDVISKDFEGNSIIIKNIEYTPNANFNGSDNLVYSLSDNKGGIINKTLNITINPLNDAPIAENDNVSLNEDDSIKINILENDIDIEDSSFDKNNIIIMATALHGKITLNNDLTFTYSPNQDFNGNDSFSYQVKDKNGALSNIANVYLNIAPINDGVAIDGVAESQNLIAGKFFSYNISSLGFNDIDGDDINVNIKLANGDNLPDWLSFDSSTKILSGTSSEIDIGNLKLQLNASDGKIKTIQNFDLTIGKNISKNLKIDVNVIVVSTNNEIVFANEGTIDIVIGDDLDNTLQYLQDSVWLETNVFALNSYTNDQFFVIGKLRSFDAFDGGAGNNTLNLTDGDDVLALDDLISSNPSASGFRLFGIKTINAKGGNDIIDLSSSFFSYGDVVINGSDGNDILWGNDGSDIINGDFGGDHIVGGRGNDILSGNEGNDIIKGYNGNDVIIGGKNADVLVGGIGNDQFIFIDLTDSTKNESDIILDFVSGEDKIIFSGLKFDSITQGIGSNSSTNGIDYYFDGGNTIIEDPNSNFSIKLTGEINLNNDDFIF